MDNEIYHVDKNGNKVEATSPEVAYQVNPSDPTSEKFVESLKDPDAAKPGPVSAGVVTSTEDLGLTSKKSPIVEDKTVKTRKA